MLRLPKARQGYQNSDQQIIARNAAPIYIALLRIPTALLTLPFPLLGWVLSIVADELDYPIAYAGGYLPSLTTLSVKIIRPLLRR